MGKREVKTETHGNRRPPQAGVSDLPRQESPPDGGVASKIEEKPGASDHYMGKPRRHSVLERNSDGEVYIAPIKRLRSREDEDSADTPGFGPSTSYKPYCGPSRNDLKKARSWMSMQEIQRRFDDGEKK